MNSWKRWLVVTLGLMLEATVAAGARGNPALAPVPIRDVRVDDAFWSPKREVWEKVTIPDCLNKFEKDGAFENFDRIRDGRSGEHGGPPWYDGLVYETVTGAADFLAERPDPQLRQRVQGYIGRIAAAAAKDPDGYLNTWTQLKEPTHRWGVDGGDDLRQHDLYNAGCMIEAGVHWYRATGDTTLLGTAARFANLMCDVMGPPPRRNIVPGHAVGETALAEMYDLFRCRPELKKQFPFAIDEARYLELGRFWIDSRGNHAGRRSYGAYDQDDRPVLEQETLEGHAVRATLMAAGLTALASAADRNDYRREARRLWENMAGRRMYVTGGVGAVTQDEKFGADYVLPNDGYLETCAAVGAAFFDRAMNADAGEARFADELERELYNGALCGVSLSGDRYFYENPLEAGKNRLRWAWHACPCCPPMFLKLFGAFPGCLYATGADGLYVNLYAGSVVRTRVGASEVSLRQTTRYPWEGDVRLTVESDDPAEFGLNLRVPGWCQGPARPDDLYTPTGRPESGAFSVKVNGEAVDAPVTSGYARLRRRWQRGDVVEVRMEMPARRVTANPKVAAAAGRVALARGPLVYCLESVDNDGRVRNLALPDDSALRADFRPDLLGGVAVIRAAATASFAGAAEPRPAELTAVPYYANANRGPVSMCVWVPRSAADALPATVAETAAATASHANPTDTLAALNDGRAPKSSDDASIPRFTWWDHRGTAEWVQYTFDHPVRLSAASVYWWDERRVGRHCRVPASWRLVYRTAGDRWVEVSGASGYGTDIDRFNRVTFDPVETTEVRIEARLQPEWSGGILEWRLEKAAPPPATAPPPSAAAPATAPANPQPNVGRPQTSGETKP